MDPSTVGSRLRDARERAGLSRPELAERAKLSPDAIEKIETGLRPYPRISTIVVLARALGIAVDWLATGEQAA